MCNIDVKPILYPLCFEPNLKCSIWGGQNINIIKGLPVGDKPVGESWEVSALPGSISVVSNGQLAGRNLTDLTREYGALMLGGNVARKYEDKFPLLVKLIDASRDLSIQVHPDDTLARELHGCFGKTEMWYVMKAEPNAYIYSGLNRSISKDEYTRRVEDRSICEVLQRHEVKEGDVFYIPAGRIHAICGGVMVAEIQQSSDITYRIFDYNRPGLDGKPRQLHTEEAKGVIDYNVYEDYRTHYAHRLNQPVSLVKSPFFTVNLLEVNIALHRELYRYDSFIIYMCIEGDCTISINSSRGFGDSVMPAEEDAVVHLTKGDSCLIPYCVADVYIVPDNPKVACQLLETYMENP